MNLQNHFADSVAIANLRNSVDLSFEVGGCLHEIEMELFLDVEDNWIGAAFRAGPERLSRRCLLVLREVKQQLLNLVAEVLFELQTSPLHAVEKCRWPFIDQSALEAERGSVEYLIEAGAIADLP